MKEFAKKSYDLDTQQRMVLLNQNFFYTPLRAPFLEALHAYFSQHLTQREAFEALLLLPTKRGIRNVRSVFQQQTKDQTLILPKMVALSHLSEMSHFDPGLPILSPWQRFLQLQEFIKKTRAFEDCHIAQVTHTFMTLIDEWLISDVSIEQLDQLKKLSHSQHFEKTTQLLQEILPSWFAHLKKQGYQEKRQQERMWMHQLCAYVGQVEHPIVLAGTTGTVPSTRSLIKILLKVPHGHVILPTFDPFDDAPAFATLHHLCTFLKATPKPLISQENSSQTPCLIETEDDLEESNVVATLVRFHLEDETRRIVIVCPSGRLTQRITAALSAYDVIPNTSLGVPFSKTPAGCFIMQILNLFQTGELLYFFAVLYHPMMGETADQRRLLLESARAFEKMIRQHPYQPKTLSDLKDSEIPQLLREFSQCIKQKSLEGLACIFQNYVNGENAREDVQVLKAYLEQIQHEALPLEICHLLLDFMPSIADPKALGSRVRMIGTLEARLMDGDVVILTGLNRGTWPADRTADPWLNEKMRHVLGLPTYARKLSLMEHDFLSCLNAPHVYMTRATHVDGTPMQASSFLQKIKTNEDSRWLDWTRHRLQKNVFLIEPKSSQACPPLAARPRRYSVSDIALLMQDPYGYFAHKILRLSPWPLFSQKPTGAHSGQMIHAFLAQWIEAPPSNTHDALHEMLQRVQHHPAIYRFWRYGFEEIVDWLTQRFQAYEAADKYTEKTGEMHFKTVDFTLFARADLILKNAAQCRIIDYKTGTLPSKRDLEYGFAPQIPLELLIAEHGGFHIKEQSRNLDGEFWHIQGRDACRVQALNWDAEKSIQTQEGITRLMGHFLREDTFYHACPHPKHAPVFHRFEHLERR